jgi:hypothetical protein
LRVFLFSVSPGCALRLFPDVLTDFVAEVRNLVGDVGSRFFTASGCDQQADSHADPHPDSQSNSFAEYLRIFLAAKRVGGAAQAVRGGIIGVANSSFDVARIGWRALKFGSRRNSQVSGEAIQLFYSDALLQLQRCLSIRSQPRDTQDRHVQLPVVDSDTEFPHLVE